MKVSFLIGGAQKGGTTALDAFLRQHPEICMASSLKEVHYFDTEKHFEGKPDYRKYHAHFSPQKSHRVIGEATPIYMYWEPAARRIWSYNPDMKWILVLRNPVDRAFSAWNMERRRGAERLSFEEAMEHETVRCREALPLQHRVYSYLDRGFYAHQVRRLFRIFGEENCLVLLNEDLSNQHADTLKRVFRFLGVDTGFVPAASRVFEHDYSEPLDPGVRGRLSDLFRHDIRELERLLRRDLGPWTVQQPPLA